MDNNDSRDIAYLIVGAGFLVVINRIWTLRMRPWLAQYFGILHDDAGAPVLRIFKWQLTSIDLIATAVLTVCLYVIYRIVRSRLANARRRADDDDGSRIFQDA